MRMTVTFAINSSSAHAYDGAVAHFGLLYEHPYERDTRQTTSVNVLLCGAARVALGTLGTEGLICDLGPCRGVGDTNSRLEGC